MRTTLVLSGGADLGVAQAGMIIACLDSGMKFQSVKGTSIGAYNGSFVAQGKSHLMEKMWTEINNKQIGVGKINFWSIAKMLLFNRDGMFPNDKIIEFLKEHVDITRAWPMDFECNLVFLNSEKEEWHRYGDVPDIRRSILASGTMSTIWEPVNFGHDIAVDGGIRTQSGLSRAVKDDPDHIVVINTGNYQGYPDGGWLYDVLEESRWRSVVTLRRTLSIILNQILNDDIKTFMAINQLAMQAEDKGVELTLPSGKPLKYIPTTILEPTKDLKSTLEFGRIELFYESYKDALNQLKR